MVQTWFLPVIAALLFCLPSEARGFSSQCSYKGYAPGAINKVQRSKAVKPAQFETSILQQTLAHMNAGGGVSAAAIGVVDAIGDGLSVSPQMTAALGVMAIGIGFLQESPSPQDILDRAHESVDMLSKEVNDMMDQMQDYADAKTLDLERNLMKANYRKLFDRWFGCAKEATIVMVNDCQRRAVEALRINRYQFQPLHSKFEEKTYDYRNREKLAYSPNFAYRASAGTWQWMEKECGSRMECLTHDEVKRIEIGIIPFRDYATLHLLALKTLTTSYAAQPINNEKVACRNYKRFLKETATKADMYARYAKWAYEWDYIRQYEENDFFGVPGRAGGRSSRAFRGGYLGTAKCSGNKCEVQCTQMFKDNTCTATGGDTFKLKDELSKKCEKFVAEVKKQVNEFWNSNILNAAKEWDKYAKDAQEKLKAAKCSSE